MKLPIGISDFKNLIQGNYTLVDKSLLIKELIDDSPQVILLTRPRRFGKTLNLSMLYYFLQMNSPETNNLFKNLAISEDRGFCNKHQNQYPVIFISFKGVKQSNYTDAYNFILYLISSLYKEHRYLLENDSLLEEEKTIFIAILKQEAELTQISTAIKNLSQYLARKFNKQAVILIDEYDTPIQEAYLQGYYAEMVTLMRGILGEALKDNSYLYKAVLTGITKVSQESIFSGLNNIKVYSLLTEKYGQYFGFTELEVKALITQARDHGVTVELEDIKYWYNGYQIGQHILYNPWSIINCLSNDGVLDIYWVNTSSNELLTRLLGDASAYIKQQLEQLMQGQVIEQPLAKDLVFLQLKTREEALWSLLLSAGYLKILSSELKGTRLMAKLAIPNKEVSFVYDRIVESWFNNEAISLESYDRFMQSLVAGDSVKFKNYLANYMLQTGSYFDFNENTAEQVFHVFILGLVVGLRNQYYIYSNREAGFGRFDVLLLPHDKQRQGIVLEFKTVDATNSIDAVNNTSDIDAASADGDGDGDGGGDANTISATDPASAAKVNNLLKAKAEAALQQIKAKQYVQLFTQHQVKQVLAIGLAFCGKRVELAAERLNLA